MRRRVVVMMMIHDESLENGIFLIGVFNEIFVGRLER